MLLHSLCSNRGKVAKEGGNRILKVEGAESRMNCHLMVVLPWSKNANVKRLQDVSKMRRKPEELDMVLEGLQLKGLIDVRFVSVKEFSRLIRPGS